MILSLATGRVNTGVVGATVSMTTFKEEAAVTLPAVSVERRTKPKLPWPKADTSLDVKVLDQEAVVALPVPTKLAAMVKVCTTVAPLETTNSTLLPTSAVPVSVRACASALLMVL